MRNTYFGYLIGILFGCSAFSLIVGILGVSFVFFMLASMGTFAAICHVIFERDKR